MSEGVESVAGGSYQVLFQQAHACYSLPVRGIFWKGVGVRDEEEREVDTHTRERWTHLYRKGKTQNKKLLYGLVDVE